jgi:hypothetical protein
MTVLVPQTRRRSASRTQPSKVVTENVGKNVEALGDKAQKLLLHVQNSQRQKENYDSHVTSLGRLPVEILSEIMGVCIQKGVKIHELTHICGHLRDIVVAMTSAWSCIRITPFYRFSGYGEDVLGVSIVS